VQNTLLHRCCFLIYDLDESESSLGHTFTDLVNSSHKGISIASGFLKLCVSIREHNIFDDSLQPRQRIRIQDLTKGDLERYVTSELSKLRVADHRSLQLERAVQLSRSGSHASA
jgi:hypothetical protein